MQMVVEAINFAPLWAQYKALEVTPSVGLVKMDYCMGAPESSVKEHHEGTAKNVMVGFREVFGC